MTGHGGCSVHAVKIDFQQGFNAVQRLINTRAKAAYDAADVRVQDSRQPVDFKAQLSQQTESTRALNLPPPPPISAPPLAAPSPSSLGVKPSVEGVKAPTVLSVERISQPLAQAVGSQALSIRPEPVSFGSEARASLTRSIPEARKLTELITNAGVDSGVDPALGIAVATAESSLNPTAVSADGHASKGLFQLLDRTGVELHRQAGGKSDEYDPFNPALNVRLGMGYLRKLHEYFSEPTEIAGIGTTVPAANSSSLEKLAVAAFNAGEGRVTSAQSRAAKLGLDPSQYDYVSQFLPDSTQSYVTKVINLKRTIREPSREDDDFT